MGSRLPTDSPNPTSREGTNGSSTPAGSPRVLLLEDDPAFNLVLTELLTETGYRVVAVRNGTEGVQELLLRDFSIILCDMMMPSLPGDMFYRAVERIRPKLCARFLFMTGHRGNEKTNAFIRSVNGRVLLKPFSLGELLEAIAQLDAPASAAPVVLTDGVRAERDALCAPPPRATWPRAASAPAASAAPVREPVPAAAAKTSPRRRLALCADTLLLLLCVFLSGLLGKRYLEATAREVQWRPALQEAEADWTVAQQQREAVEPLRQRFEALRELPRTLATARDAAGWAPALAALSTAAGPEIEIATLKVEGRRGDWAACDFHISGRASGASPHALAERFRVALLGGLERECRGPVTVRFSQLDEEPTASDGATPQVRFSIAARIGRKMEGAP